MSIESSARNQGSLVCMEGRHVVNELVEVLVADPIALSDLGLQRICPEHVASLRAAGLVLEAVA